MLYKRTEQNLVKFHQNFFYSNEQTDMFIRHNETEETTLKRLCEYCDNDECAIYVCNIRKIHTTHTDKLFLFLIFLRSNAV